MKELATWIRIGKAAAAAIALIGLVALFKQVVLADTNRELLNLKQSVMELNDTVSLTAYIIAEPDSSLRAQAVRDLRRHRIMRSK